MNRTAKTLRSTIGAKALMAVTGVALLLFVLGHMVGNLQVFGGRDMLNKYAHTLQSLGPLLWVIRGALLAILLLHVWAALQVTRANRAARPVAYEHARQDLATSYAARTMLVSGVVVVLFLIYHVLHFTVGAVDFAGSYGGHADLDGTEVHDVYGMVIGGFKHLPTALIYVVANLILVMHIAHGAASLLQTLGFRSQANAGKVRAFGLGFGVLIGIGNLAMPLSIMFGMVGD